MKVTSSFPLRMPEKLRHELERLAEINGRSLNNEIVARLEAGMFSPESVEIPTAETAIAAIKQGVINKAGATYSILMKEIAKGIANAVAQGHRYALIEVREIDATLLTAELEDLKHESVGEKILNKLTSSGYKVEITIGKDFGFRADISF